MKIGLLINSIEQLDNWQLRVLDGIYSDEQLDLVLLLANNKSDDWRLSTSKNFVANTTKLIGATDLLLKGQYFLETSFFFKPLNVSLKNDIESYRHTLDSYELKCANENGTSVYGKKVSNDLKNLRLDLIINLDVQTIDSLLFTVSKHGVWEMLFQNLSLKKTAPVGFFEVLKKKPVIGATLCRIAPNSEENEVLNTAYFNRHWSMTETATIVAEGSVSLFLKNLEKLKKGALEVHSNFSHEKIAYQNLSFQNVLGYLILFYSEFLNKLFEKVMAKVFQRRYECWTIFTGSKGFFDRITSSPVQLIMPKDEFWADPFLFHHDDKDYLFFENYSYKTKRGKISCGILEDGQLSEIGDVLDFNFHLSFPFIFEENGEIYLMPESSENKKLEVFKAVAFPFKWELYATAFEGEAVGDAFFHTDEEQQKWLFLNKQAAKTAPMNSELFIYKVDSCKFNSLIPHHQNPVLIDARVARNGGSIFKHNNQWYRPSQRNVDGVYGRALNINRIDKLTIDEYIETTVQIIEPDFDKNLMGLHHLHQCNGTFVFDAAYRYRA